MASEFALKLTERHFETTKTIGAQRLADNVDAELQEVREALELLQNLPYQKPSCFCRVKWVDGEHDGPCQRARALMEKLSTREK
jgi:hypothetical protein